MINIVSRGILCMTVVIVMPKKLKLGRHRKYHYKKKSCSLVVEHGPVTQVEVPSLVLSIPLKVAGAPSLKVMQRWFKHLSLASR